MGGLEFMTQLNIATRRMLRSIIILALIFCAILVTTQSAPAGNEQPNNSESKFQQGRNNNSEEDDSEDKDVATRKANTAGESTVSNKERRDLLGNTHQQGQDVGRSLQQPQEPLQHNLSGVTYRPVEQTTLKVEGSPTTGTTTTTERVGYLGPIQSLFP